MDREALDRLIADLTNLRESIAAPTGSTGLDLDRSEWLTGILAHSPDVISILDLEGRLIFLSRTVPGTDPRALHGKLAADYVPGPYRERWVEAVTRAIEHKQAQRVEILSTLALWWDTRIIPIERDGAVSGLITIGTDITLSKRAEAALALRDAQLRLALEASGMGQWSWLVESDRVHWDAATKRIFSWPEDDDDIDFEAFLALVHAEDRERVKTVVLHAVESGEYPDVTFRVALADGSTRWVLCKGRVLQDSSGKASELMGGIIDITDGKRTEAQLNRSQKLEAIGQLAGGVAHDFNNLLVAILGNLSLARGCQDAEERALLLGDATAAGNRAAELTRQLLAFSTRQPVNQATVEVNSMLGDTLKLLRRLVPESVKMDFIAGHRLPRVLADRGQLEQVVVNLCVNARDAMPNGGRLVIETELVLVNGRFRETHPWVRSGRYVLMSVTDTGVGIPPEALDHVFEPFYTTKAQGSGLGLATAYGVVRRHGGFMHLYSEVGKGTTFKVYLPVSARDAADVGTKVEGPVSGGSESILVAEDEPRVRAVVVRILERAGYRVITAEDGEQAVRKFEDHQRSVDLVLLDAVMPNKSGAEALTEIRARAPRVAAILCSGYSDSLATVAGLGDDVTFLAKPYEPDELLRVVRRQLDARARPAD
jgi:two-component system, cell cycle sensor histidine kinase and response regulator CckA